MPRKNSDARARFAQRLRAIRVPRGFKTARSFAEALDIDENRYTRYERGEVEPDLQLLMKICTLLSATPNDLLCDTIGQSPVELGMVYGFADREAAPYHAGAVATKPAPPAAVGGAAQQSGSLGDARKTAAWQMAEVVAMLEAGAGGIDFGALSPLDRLRRTGPIFAHIEADAFGFLRELPTRLHNVNIDANTQSLIGSLMDQMVATGKPASNDNG